MLMLKVSPGTIGDAKLLVARDVSPPKLQLVPHAAGSKLELVRANARALEVIVGGRGKIHAGDEVVEPAVRRILRLMETAKKVPGVKAGAAVVHARRVLVSRWV